MRKVLQKVYKPEMDSNTQWADLRSDEVRKCYKLGEDFIVINGDHAMILTPDDLKNKIIGKTDLGNHSELFAYEWKPTKKINEL